MTVLELASRWLIDNSLIMAQVGPVADNSIPHNILQVVEKNEWFARR